MVAYKGKPKLKAAEYAHLMRILDRPCVACIPGYQELKTEAHHIVDGNRRLGPWYLLPLCAGHHRTYTVNITTNKRALEAEFGSERLLWELLMSTLEVTHVSWPESKILARKS